MAILLMFLSRRQCMSQWSSCNWHEHLHILKIITIYMVRVAFFVTYVAHHFLLHVTGPLYDFVTGPLPSDICVVNNLCKLKRHVRTLKSGLGVKIKLIRLFLHFIFSFYILLSGLLDINITNCLSYHVTVL